MNKIIQSLIALVLICFALPAAAVTQDCFVVASGTYTSTQSTALIAAPRTARRVIYVQHVTAVSGTSPSMTSILRHSFSSSIAATSNLTLAAASAVSAVGDYSTHGVTSGKYVMPLQYWNVNMTITGTTPSFTVQHLACYDDRGE